MKRPTHYKLYDTVLRGYPSLAAAKRDLRRFSEHARAQHQQSVRSYCRAKRARLVETEELGPRSADGGAHGPQNYMHFISVVVPVKRRRLA